MREWNKQSTEIHSDYQQVRRSFLSITKPACCPIFSIHNFVSAKLRLDISDLREYKFRNNFHDNLNASCSCGLEPETTEKTKAI